VCGATAGGRGLSTIPAVVPVTGRIVPIIPGRVVVPAPCVLQRLVEIFRVDPRLLKRSSAHPVRERKFHCLPDIVAGDDGPPLEGGDRLCRPDNGDVGAVGSDPEPDARLRHRVQESVISRDRRQQRPGSGDRFAQFLLCRGVRLPALPGIALEGLGGPDDRHTLGGVHAPLHGHLQPEPVQELRPQFTLLGIHGADQDEPGGVGEGYPFAFHHVDAHGGSIEEDVGHVVVQQIDLIDVEDAAVDRREDTRVDGHRSFTDRPLHVDGANHPVLGHPKREVDDADPAPLHLQVLVMSPLFSTGRTQAAIAGGIATIGAAADDIDPGEHVGKRPDCGGLGRPFLAADEYAANPRVDGIEDECAFHRLLADDGGERENVPPCLV